MASSGKFASRTGEDGNLEYFWGSVKIMLIVGGLAVVISMLVAGVIKLLFVVIRGRTASAAIKADAAKEAPSRPAGSEPGKAA